MALIEKAKGRRINQSPSGYTRLFGIDALGNLMSRIQGTVISSGTELEKLIWERVRQIADLDNFIETTLNQPKKGMWVARKQQIKLSKFINSKHEPDFIAFNLYDRICYILELKDGDQFDTKKSSGEYSALHNFNNDISQSIPFSTHIYICSFNSTTKKEIYDGFKHKFPIGETLTGQELCDLLHIDYQDIIKVRTNTQQANLEYFINELLQIGVIRQMLELMIKEHKL
jgi:hypothetical protein